MKPRIAPLLLVVGLVAGPAWAEDAAPPSSEVESRPFTLFAGGSAWSGDYGSSTNTTITAALAGVQYRVGGLRLSASLPWMRISSHGAVFTGIDGAPLIVAPSFGPVRTVREGVGDLTLGASYLVPAVTPLGVDIDLRGKVKVPTGSVSKGVSTGKADYAFGAEVSKPLGRFVPAVAVNYRIYGDAGAWKLKDGVAVSASGTYILAHHIAAVATYDYAQAASAYIADSHSVTGAVSAPLAPHGLRLTAFVSKGLSNGAAEVSGGLSLSARL